MNTRDDLKLRGLAKSLGWQEQFNVHDLARGRTGENDKCPHFPISFRKGDWETKIVTVWKIPGGWRSAFMARNVASYFGHETHASLESALRKF